MLPYLSDPNRIENWRKALSQNMAFDLLSILPQLLPSAIAWVEAQSLGAQQAGHPLDMTGLALARRVGVQRPERIRTLIVDALPLPDEPVLRQAAVATGLLGPGMIGLTLGYSIFIVRGYMEPRLLSMNAAMSINTRPLALSPHFCLSTCSRSRQSGTKMPLSSRTHVNTKPRSPDAQRSGRVSGTCPGTR
jgi:hypothetical protein